MTITFNISKKYLGNVCVLGGLFPMMPPTTGTKTHKPNASPQQGSLQTMHIGTQVSMRRGHFIKVSKGQIGAKHPLACGSTRVAKMFVQQLKMAEATNIMLRSVQPERLAGKESV